MVGFTKFQKPGNTMATVYILLTVDVGSKEEIIEESDMDLDSNASVGELASNIIVVQANSNCDYDGVPVNIIDAKVLPGDPTTTK